MRTGRGIGGTTALVVAGAALAGSGVAVLLRPEARVASDVGTVLFAPERSAPAGSTVLTESSPAARESPTAAVAPPRLSDPSHAVPVPAGFVPQRLVVESLGIDAPMVATTVDAEGALMPPEDPAQLGWWRGVRPSEGSGSVLVAGHLDSRRYGQGLLALIVQLAPGDRAVVTGADGEKATYVVRGVQTFPKEALPAGALFGTDGPERLVLVTCGGTYDGGHGGWDSNVVAVLDPALRT